MSSRSVSVLIALCLVACAAPSETAPPAESSDGAAIPAAVASGEPYAPAIEPAQFVVTVDHLYFPLAPGTRWVYEGLGDLEGEVDTVEVLTATRTVNGVECTVVRDVVSLDGEPVEVTEDWYAQDASGNVWYFGEETAEYEDGEIVSTAGAWEAGVDGAQPGIIMPATPAIGVTYRQEFYAGEAEDVAVAVEVDQSVDVPAGSFDAVLVTEDWTPLEPDSRERKSYAPGVGLVMEEIIEGGAGGFQLVEHSVP